MAPLAANIHISDLDVSSLELDSRSSSSLDLPSYLSSLSLSEREALIQGSSPSDLGKRSPTSTYAQLGERDLLAVRNTVPAATTTRHFNPASGSVSPDAFNNKGIQALFALIGASFVLGAIWFFFWAKNGGFQWRKGDWEDYKSTVLRRKGPNGTTLSNATKSTRLGGGSIVGQGYSDHDGATITDMSSEAPVMKEKQRDSTKKSKKSASGEETAKDRKIREVKEASWEGGHDDDVRAYRHEKAARVGGMNRDSDAMHYGTDYSETNSSVMYSHHHRQDQKNSKNHSRQASPEKRPSAPPRRDFSYDHEESFTAEPRRPARYHSPSKTSTPPPRSSRVGAGYMDPFEFDVQSQNTRSYHHPIPGLSGGQQGTRNGGTGVGGGFRRGRDELDD